VNVELGHAGPHVGPRPGVAGLAGAHAAAQQGDFVGVFLPPHGRDRRDDRGGVGIAGPVVDAQAAALRVDGAEQGQLTRPAPGRLRGEAGRAPEGPKGWGGKGGGGARGKEGEGWAARRGGGGEREGAGGGPRRAVNGGPTPGFPRGVGPPFTAGRGRPNTPGY